MARYAQLKTNLPPTTADSKALCYFLSTEGLPIKLMMLQYKVGVFRDTLQLKSL